VVNSVVATGRLMKGVEMLIGLAYAPLKTPVAHVLLRAASTLVSMSAKRRD